jgi:hypothetical protein
LRPLLNQERSDFVSAFDPAAFVDALGAELAIEAPDDVRTMIFLTPALQAEVLAFQADAKAGLAAVVARAPGAVEKLGASLRSRKTQIVAACPGACFTVEQLVEQLVGRAIQKVVTKAQEIQRPSLA